MLPQNVLPTKDDFYFYNLFLKKKTYCFISDVPHCMTNSICLNEATSNGIFYLKEYIFCITNGMIHNGTTVFACYVGVIEPGEFVY